MKKKTKKVFLFVMIIFIIVIFFIRNKTDFKNQFQDQFIFFRLFSSKEGDNKNTLISKEQKDSKEKAYIFEVSYHNIDFKEIFLLDTIHKDSLIYKKIAPGTEGEFEILLKTNKKINYQIKFDRQNQKPKNLSFQIEGKDRKYEKLEDMEEELNGELIGNKTIKILWKWEYEKDTKQNLQDTEDGETIKQFNFIIYAIGK